MHGMQVQFRIVWQRVCGSVLTVVYECVPSSGVRSVGQDHEASVRSNEPVHSNLRHRASSDC